MGSLSNERGMQECGDYNRHSIYDKYALLQNELMSYKRLLATQITNASANTFNFSPR